MSVAERLLAVRLRIEAAALACGRAPASVKLVAVSKTVSEEEIRQAYAAGQRAFGESYAQELERKAVALVDLPGLEWHFIGHLQANKAKVVVKYAHMVHSVDGIALATELGRRAVREGRKPLSVLIEVNVGGEPQKHGVAPSEIDEVMRAIAMQPALDLQGLMTVPPGEPEATRRAFSTLRSLRSLHGGIARLPALSMGMSSDLPIAIEEGATIVRVGTAIFGPRAAG